jgi:cell division protein FtsB
MLFAGGMVTKLVMILALAGFLGSGASCALKTHDLKQANKNVATLQQKNTELSTDNVILKQNIGTLKSNIDSIVKTNEANVEVNRKLVAERTASKAVIASLAANTAKTKASLDDANKKIEEMLKNPANDAPVAPVLLETLRDIQKGKK